MYIHQHIADIISGITEPKKQNIQTFFKLRETKRTTLYHCHLKTVIYFTPELMIHECFVYHMISNAIWNK